MYRVKSKGRVLLQGPFCTCTMTAETFLSRVSHKVRPGQGRPSVWKIHVLFTCFLTLGLITALLFVFSVIFLILFYIWVLLFTRFQYKLTILLLLLRVRHFDFTVTNYRLHFALQVTKLIVGMLGYLTVMVIQL